MYPSDWPKCVCGAPVLDRHVTCGAATCDEAGERLARARRALYETANRFVDLQCSHVWIDPTEPPIERAPYSPFGGELRRQMKPGRVYRCQRCGERGSLPAPAGDEPAA